MNLNNLHGIAIALAIVFSFATHPVLAQEEPVLPDLAPREVEITGNLSIAFPSLDRQPLIGFNPPPRVPEIPDSREPFTEPYKQPSADLPPSPLTPPDPPAVSTVAQRTLYDGVVEAGAGRYIERFLRADISLVRSDRLGVILESRYRGSAGHQPFDPVSSADSDYDYASGELTLRKEGRSVRMAITGGGTYDRYSLFGVDPVAGSISQPDPDRLLSDFQSTVSLASPDNAPHGFSLSVKGGRTEIDTDVFDPAVRVDPATTRVETYLEAAGTGDLRIGEIRLKTSLSGRTAGLDTGGFPGSTLRSGHGSAALAWKPAPRMHVSAGAAVLGFDSEAQSSTGTDRRSIWIAPSGSFSFAMSPSSNLYGRVGSSLERTGLADTYSQMPFIEDEPLILPTLTAFDGHVGVRTARKVFTADIRGGYKDIPWYGYAEHQPTPVRGYARGYPSLQYDSAAMVYASGSATVILSTDVQFGLNAEYRDAELDELNTDIPYLSPIVIGGHASVAFLNGGLLAQIDGRYESARFRDTRESLEIPAAVTAGVSLSWFFTDEYALLVGGRHVGGEPEFWDRYPEASSVVYGGIRMRW